jgi:hypothetical protein
MPAPKINSASENPAAAKAPATTAPHATADGPLLGGAEEAAKLSDMTFSKSDAAQSGVCSVIKQGDENDDRDRHAEKPKQYSTSHDAASELAARSELLMQTGN